MGSVCGLDSVLAPGLNNRGLFIARDNVGMKPAMTRLA